TVGASSTGFTFDNVAGLGGTVGPFPLITTLSATGINGAFTAPDGAVGSPGRTSAPVDVTAPTIDEVTDITVDATSPSGAVVTYTSPATHDDVDGDGIATCTPASGSTFEIGTTTVTCTAQDAAGNVAEPEMFTVEVVGPADVTAPTIDPVGNITV